jgi:probable HAF family extracellular repeat protein
MTRLATFDAGGDDPYHGAAAGINDRGDVVGAARAASGEVRAVMWRDGHLVDLGLPGTGGYAVAVNDRGDVVGAYAGADGGEHAYLWRHATVTRLGTGPRFTVRDINDRGIVAGSVLDRPEAPTAVVWRRGTFVNLAGPDAEATSVNERGQVVGWSNVTPGNQLRAVRWEHDSTTNLGVLPGGTGSAAVSINNRGQILGWSEDRRPRRTAFLWENGVLIDLSARGVPVDSVPIALNDHGGILANVFTGDGYGRAALFRLP